MHATKAAIAIELRAIFKVKIHINLTDLADDATMMTYNTPSLRGPMNTRSSPRPHCSTPPTLVDVDAKDATQLNRHRKHPLVALAMQNSKNDTLMRETTWERLHHLIRGSGVSLGAARVGKH
jgi:hypothetical protein